MSSLTVALVLSICAILFTGVTAFFSVLAYAKVVGLEKSTHKIQWVPIPEEDQGPTGKELVKDFEKHMYPDVEKEQV